MRAKPFFSVLMTLLLSTTLAWAEARTYQVDSAHSSVAFTVTHLQLSEVEGRFDDFDGKIVWDDANPANSKIEWTVKATSVNTGAAKRDEHLRSKDFFDVATYPELSFKSTSVRKLSGSKYEVKGDMTIHGVTKSISVPVEIKGPIDAFGDGKMSIGFKSSFKLNRIEYKVGDGWKGGSDKLVSHDVFVTIRGEAHQPDGK
ncbi:MAG: YceI family protein [Vulcanimicrobiota bacterium]